MGEMRHSAGAPRARIAQNGASAQSDKAQQGEDDNNRADDVNDLVHGNFLECRSLSRSASTGETGQTTENFVGAVRSAFCLLASPFAKTAGQSGLRQRPDAIGTRGREDPACILVDLTAQPFVHLRLTSCRGLVLGFFENCKQGRNLLTPVAQQARTLCNRQDSAGDPAQNVNVRTGKMLLRRGQAG